MARGPATLLLVAAAACSRPTDSADVEPQPAAKEEPPTCREPLEVDVAARFDGKLCSWLLVRDGDALRLDSMALDPPPSSRGPVPEVCRQLPCAYEGALTSLGPLVLAIEPSPASEMPAGVYLGVPGGGERLDFVDLWAGAGEGVSVHSTVVGPAHALAPFACDGKLALFVVPRLNAARDIEPEPTLLAREGVVVGLGAAKRDRGGCEPLNLRVP